MKGYLGFVEAGFVPGGTNVRKSRTLLVGTGRPNGRALEFHARLFDVVERTRDSLAALAERAANSLNDADSEWWPFLFLRVRQHEFMSVARTLLLALAYALPAALFAVALGSALGDSVGVRELAGMVSIAFLATFLFLLVGVTYFWNRRAARLQALRVRARSRRR